MPTTLSEIATFLGVLIILWKALRITPKEGKFIDAEIMKKYDEAIANQLARNSKLDEFIAKLETEKEEWHEERRQLLSEVSDLRSEVGVLKTSIDRLSAQVVSLGGTPVVKLKKEK